MRNLCPLSVIAITLSRLLPSASSTYGIDHDYLGPVLRVKQGPTLPFDVVNRIEDTSTLHWQGLHFPAMLMVDRIDEKVRKGDTEVWRISVDDQLHPFHIHGCSFRILSQHGSDAPAYAQGWKDMVHFENGWSEVLVKFDYDAPVNAPYVYHCHILEHEDCGMMGQFTVT